jgi:chromosome segregation and condensation protein ScpB
MEKELHVPAVAMLAVASVLTENELVATITGSDDEGQTITLELQYEKADRAAIHEIEDLIEEHTEDSDDDEDDEEDEDEEDEEDHK